MKVWTEPMKAEQLSGGQLDRWLEGKRSRRVLVIPFTGPLPGGKAGLDLDGEYFDEDTDLVGAYPVLAKTRERLVDWHHDNDPTGAMKGALIGRIVLDEKAVDGEGLWADFWANAGEQRRALMARLERDGVPLYGSSQPVQPGVRKGDLGHIDVWPIVRHTITTSPQNTHAVVPSLKALLDGSTPYDALSLAAFKAALLGEVADSPLGTLQGTPAGERSGTASPAQLLRLAEALDALAGLLTR